MPDIAISEAPVASRPVTWLGTAAPFLLVAALAVAVPFTQNDYWTSIATRAAIYWLLIAGLNLVVGYAGQLAIGYVALLALGAYTASILIGGNVLPEMPILVAFAAATGVGAIAGLVIGLPALRLRSFYFAMTTLGFATIVYQTALGWQEVTGGGIGLPGPALPAPLDSILGFYLVCLGIAAAATWAYCNVGNSRFGRALIALRDADVAAEAAGIGKTRLFLVVFIIAGATAGLAGALFATMQTYITPEAFNFDLSVLFFIAILIGGRGSVAGPLIGTIVLTILPEIAAPLAAWSTTLYAALLLVIVLAIPGGIASLIDARNWRRLPEGRVIAPRPRLLNDLLTARHGGPALQLRDIVLRFGGLTAVNHLDLDVAAGTVHGLIGPNGSGKTTTLNVISGYYRPQEGQLGIGDEVMTGAEAVERAKFGIARTFQTPRIVGEATVLDNVMVGADRHAKAGMLEAFLSLPRYRADERSIRARALLALRVVGLEALADFRADRLQHSELRFVEIARALTQEPRFLLLDEPAAGLSPEEIRRLGTLVKAIAAESGIGVLLVEHHADLIFEICDQVTVLNLGAQLAHGTPAEIRAHKEVISAYLGG